MGYWGVGPFDNDSGADFVSELDDQPPQDKTEFIRTALRALAEYGVQTEPDEDLLDRPYAAAALVAGQRSGTVFEAAPGPMSDARPVPVHPIPPLPDELNDLAVGVLDFLDRLITSGEDEADDGNGFGAWQNARLDLIAGFREAITAHAARIEAIATDNAAISNAVAGGAAEGATAHEPTMLFEDASMRLSKDTVDIAEAARMLAVAVAEYRGTLPPADDAAAWRITDTQFARIRSTLRVRMGMRTALGKTGPAVPYVADAEPQSEPRSCFAFKVEVDDQIECEGADLNAGNINPAGAGSGPVARSW